MHMLNSFVLLILLTITSDLVTSTYLYKHDHTNRDYYTIKLADPIMHPPEVLAELLNARYEGRVGALENYHLYSIEKSATQPHLTGDEMTSSLVNRRRTLSNQSIYKRALELDNIVSVTQQVPRLRSKRSAIPPPPLAEESLETTPFYFYHHLERRRPPVPVRPNPQKEAEVNKLMQEDAGKQWDQMVEELRIFDPGFHKQWHLFNGVEIGRDINVTGVWKQNITGKGVVVAIIDDGLDLDHNDLTTNFYAPGSYDFNDHNPFPRPRLSDDTHGTRCAGEIAAVRNDVCGVGVAYDAKVSGIRILSAEITDADEAAALNYHFHENHIYSCSWGPPDDGRSAEAPQGVILDAMIKGINEGRNGTGSIFVFASGNGGGAGDNCNFDGYTNSIYTITVGAIDRSDKHPYYSESCSALLTSTYSSGDNSYIFSTDVGQNQCTERHGGTSAAAPIVAGILALALSIRPDLTWRDVQHLTIQSSYPVSLSDPDWVKLPSQRWYNHNFGYGKLNAWAIVEAAKNWQLVGSQVSYEAPFIVVDSEIPNSDSGLTSSIQISQTDIDKARLGRLEHVTVNITIEHDRRGDIEVYLDSPEGVISQLADSRKYDSSSDGLTQWTFMSVKHWEENPVGEWTLRVYDRHNPDDRGRLISWQLKLWGEVDPAFDNSNEDSETAIGNAEKEGLKSEDENLEISSLSSATSMTSSSPFSSPSSSSSSSFSSSSSSSFSSTTLTTSSTSSTLTSAVNTSLASELAEQAYTQPEPSTNTGPDNRLLFVIVGGILSIAVAIGAYLTQRRYRVARAGREYEFDVLEQQGEEEHDRLLNKGKARADNFDIEAEPLAKHSNEIVFDRNELDEFLESDGEGANDIKQ